MYENQPEYLIQIDYTYYHYRIPLGVGKVSMLTYTYSHKPMMNIKVTICI